MKVAILGTVGIPGRYGGFETLAENLARRHHTGRWLAELTVYCSAEAYAERTPRYLSANLRYSRFKANGFQSIIYDATTLLDAARSGHDVALLLGVSGAIVLPFIRMFSRMRVVTNVDGIEWRRDKWKGLARHFLRLSEWMAVRFSHEVVADNRGIADHLNDSYGVRATVIAYGGDHALLSGGETNGNAEDTASLAPGYALALCRIEPENNVAMILKAYASIGKRLVFVGNWSSSEYGRGLRTTYAAFENLQLLDPIFEPAALHRLRAGADLYVHGHSAGGTNPSLVEMMHFGVPVYAFDCVYNRYTTEDKARYFRSSVDLMRLAVHATGLDEMGMRLKEISRRAYSWQRIGNDYFELLGLTMNETAQSEVYADA
jgi:glycosyltransferase involved in cell wall biosynthesis